MKIAEVSKRYGMSADTLRYYERIGLLRHVPRNESGIREYDEVESTVFSNCINHGMVPLVESYQGELIPSRAFAEGGIHEAILAYEDTMFFEILAQELALRDMDSDAPTPENYDELRERMDVYLGEFEQHGTDNITVEM